MGAAGKSNGEAAAARMAAQCDWAGEILAAQKLDQIVEIVFVLADVVDVAAPLARHVMAAEVGQYDLCSAAKANSGSKSVVAAAMIGRAVNEDQDALGGRFINSIGELLSISRWIAPQARRVDFGCRLPQRCEIEDVLRLVD